MPFISIDFFKKCHKSVVFTTDFLAMAIGLAATWMYGNLEVNLEGLAGCGILQLGLLVQILHLFIQIPKEQSFVHWVYLQVYTSQQAVAVLIGISSGSVSAR